MRIFAYSRHSHKIRIIRIILMAIEIISKSKIRKTSLTSIPFLILAAIFLAFLFSYFALNFYQKKLTREISEIEKSLQKSPSEKNLEDGIFSYQRKLEDINPLLSNHKAVVNLFNNLGKNIHPKAWLQKFKLNMDEKTIYVFGSTDTFEILGQQILIFEKQEFIKNTNIDRVSIGKDGKINFELQIIFDPKIFAPLEILQPEGQSTSPGNRKFLTGFE